MSAATGASKAVAEDWDKMFTVTQNPPIISDAGVCMSPERGVPGSRAGACAWRGRHARAAYNVRMTERHSSSRRRLRRTAWWAAFAALAGFLLADLI